MRGGDGVPWPAAGADFFAIFLAIFYLFSTALQRSTLYILYTLPQSVGVGVARALEGIHAGGRWGPMARRRRRFFRFFCAIFHFFMGIRRTCGHAITPCDSLSDWLGGSSLSSEPRG